MGVTTKKERALATPFLDGFVCRVQATNKPPIDTFLLYHSNFILSMWQFVKLLWCNYG